MALAKETYCKEVYIETLYDTLSHLLTASILTAKLSSMVEGVEMLNLSINTRQFVEDVCGEKDYCIGELGALHSIDKDVAYKLLEQVNNHMNILIGVLDKNG